MKKVIILFWGFLLLMGCSIIHQKEYYCDEDDELKGTTCIKKHVTNAQEQYYCDGHTYTRLDGNRCCSQYFCVAANVRYYCSNGYQYGSDCIIETTYNAYER